ncbi:MAG: hypothetical protein GX987_02580 [Tissierellia bacterium]|nr:hypothetical protein [Tissierellia bacterium]
MYSTDYNYNRPAVPPLYPMDPCRPMPMPYEPAPMPEPMYPHMPMCPMMDPRFRECVQVCMMQCGTYPTPMEYPMNVGYPTDMNELNPYYTENID